MSGGEHAFGLVALQVVAQKPSVVAHEVDTTAVDRGGVVGHHCPCHRDPSVVGVAGKGATITGLVVVQVALYDAQVGVVVVHQNGAAVRPAVGPEHLAAVHLRVHHRHVVVSSGHKESPSLVRRALRHCAVLEGKVVVAGGKVDASAPTAGRERRIHQRVLNDTVYIVHSGIQRSSIVSGSTAHTTLPNLAPANVHVGIQLVDVDTAAAGGSAQKHQRIRQAEPSDVGVNVNAATESSASILKGAVVKVDKSGRVLAHRHMPAVGPRVGQKIHIGCVEVDDTVQVERTAIVLGGGGDRGGPKVCQSHVSENDRGLNKRGTHSGYHCVLLVGHEARVVAALGGHLRRVKHGQRHRAGAVAIEAPGVQRVVSCLDGGVRDLRGHPVPIIVIVGHLRAVEPKAQHRVIITLVGVVHRAEGHLLAQSRNIDTVHSVFRVRVVGGRGISIPVHVIVVVIDVVVHRPGPGGDRSGFEDLRRGGLVVGVHGVGAAAVAVAPHVDAVRVAARAYVFDNVLQLGG